LSIDLGEDKQVAALMDREGSGAGTTARKRKTSTDSGFALRMYADPSVMISPS
jgi:hypothetical protein